MKKFKDVEQTRIASHREPARDSVHRSSLLVPELPGAVAEISFLNHFLLKRGYPNVACRITAIDPEGKRIESRLEPVTEPRVYRFRLTGSVAGPVATYMVEFFAAENLFIPFPAVMVNHLGEGFTNTVHAFNRVLNDVFENDAVNAQVVPEASVDVSFRDGQDTFAVFTAGPAACDGELTVELVAPDRTRRASVPLRVPRLCQKFVSLRETFTDLSDETTGVLRIQQPLQPMFYGRMLTGIRTTDGQFSANHSYYDTSGAPEYWEDGRPSVRAYPRFAGFQSAVRMYPVQAPGEIALSVALHATDGRELCRVPAGDLASPGPRFLDSDVDLLARSAGIDPEAVSAFVVRAEAREGGVPCRTNHQLAYSSGGLASSINVSLFNPERLHAAGQEGPDVGADDGRKGRRVADRNRRQRSRRRRRGRGDGLLRRGRPRDRLEAAPGRRRLRRSAGGRPGARSGPGRGPAGLGGGALPPPRRVPVHGDPRRRIGALLWRARILMPSLANRTVAIVQARLGSRRLPGKVLEKIGDRTMLERVVERLERARRLDAIVVATSDDPRDDAIEAVCAQRGWGCHRGSETDVLRRYLDAAERFGADPIVRITADCPLIDPAVVDQVLETYAQGGRDYVANINPPTFPHGLDTEVVSADALRRAGRESQWMSEREHVTLHIRNHPERFRVGNVAHAPDLSGHRWVVDEAVDLEFVRAVYARMGDGDFGLNDVLALVEEDPGLEQINRGIVRDEGLRKSLAEDVRVVSDSVREAR